jgi:hypothetical protein
MTVLEPLRCPGCSTRYALAPARVRPGVRRAKCFRCSEIFSIEDVVARLLAAPPEPAAEVPAPAPPAAAAPAPEAAAGAPVPGITRESMDPASMETLHIPRPALPLMPPGPAPEGATGFLSARDAIARLLGETPPAPPPQPPARMGGRGAMDVEATLSALDSTLGGSPAAAPVPEPVPAPVPAPVPEPAPGPDTASTVKISSAELRQAIAAMAEAQPQAEAPRVDPEAVPVPELFKVQLDQETFSNASLDQMTTWIEQGRVKETHMVARQFSDNWLEASKVPALLPIFEHLRKTRPPQPEEPKPEPPPPPPAKRGLFSGLFGRN